MLMWKEGMDQAALSLCVRVHACLHMCGCVCVCAYACLFPLLDPSLIQTPALSGPVGLMGTETR